MRMRKLGRGQSVVFCIPREIVTNISTGRQESTDTPIEVADVIRWSITETWADLQRRMALWAVQGRRFARHKELWDAAWTGEKTVMSAEEAAKFLEREAQSIEERYRPLVNEGAESIPPANSSTDMESRIARCKELQMIRFDSAKMHEEQERELSPEVEQERQIQRPHPAKPATHSLHPDVQYLVDTGKLRMESEAFKPAFLALERHQCRYTICRYPIPTRSSRDEALLNHHSGGGCSQDARLRPASSSVDFDCGKWKNQHRKAHGHYQPI